MKVNDKPVTDSISGILNAVKCTIVDPDYILEDSLNKTVNYYLKQFDNLAMLVIVKLGSDDKGEAIDFDSLTMYEYEKMLEQHEAIYNGNHVVGRK